jgi:hypothetical protein
MLAIVHVRHVTHETKPDGQLGVLGHEGRRGMKDPAGRSLTTMDGSRPRRGDGMEGSDRDREELHNKDDHIEEEIKLHEDEGNNEPDMDSSKDLEANNNGLEELGSSPRSGTSACC